MEVDTLWEQFHRMVNMTSSDLRAFLLADAAGADGAFPDQPDLGVDPDGRRVLAVLGKRKTDLTDEDLETMERVEEQISNLLAVRATPGLDDALWRRDLMTLGHDPMRDGEMREET